MKQIEDLSGLDLDTHDSPYETVHEIMATAVDEPDTRPGMVAVIQKDFLRVTFEKRHPITHNLAWSIASTCAKSGRESCGDATCGSRQTT